MNKALRTLNEHLDRRRLDHSLRELTIKSHLVDFASNDYLGLSRSAYLHEAVTRKAQRYKFHPESATGSRLIAGNHAYYEELESFIARFHNADAALLFNSGYDANGGFFSAVPQVNDLILFDELIHASIRDGIKLSRAEAIQFTHNDIHDLERKIFNHSTYRNIYIATESIFSMDGDLAPLEEIAALCRKYDANLVVDEAHATGLFGERGEGRVGELGLENDCFARLYTYGKALGSHGAAIVGSDILRQFLVNFARPFIFTTALPMQTLLRIEAAYELLPSLGRSKKKIGRLCELLKRSLILKEARMIDGPGPVLSLVIPGNERAKDISAKLEDGGFYAKAILYPTVPRGQERIRICVHSFNTEEQIKQVASIINNSAI